MFYIFYSPHEDHLHRVFSSDDCSLSDDPCAGDSIQHRELLYHLLNGTEELLTPLFTIDHEDHDQEGTDLGSHGHGLRQQHQQLLAVR